MKTILFRVDEDTLFTAFSPVSESVGEPLSFTRTALETEMDHVLLGVWECTPGKWRRQVLQAEYSYFISGSGRFVHDNGQVINFQSGDGIFFPKNSTGIWEIESTVRKSYVILK